VPASFAVGETALDQQRGDAWGTTEERSEAGDRIPRAPARQDRRPQSLGHRSIVRPAGGEECREDLGRELVGPQIAVELRRVVIVAEQV
jgi:hypothetical protein